MSDDSSLDSLLIDTRFNVAGLDQSEQQVVAALRGITQAVAQASGSLPPLDIDTSKLTASLKAAGTDVSQFFQSFSQAASAELESMAKLGSGSQALTQASGAADTLASSLAAVARETIQTANLMTTLLSASLAEAGPALGASGKAAAEAAAEGIRSGLQSKLGELRDLLAAELISPADFQRQAQLASAAASREFAALGGQITQLTTLSGALQQVPAAELAVGDGAARMAQGFARASEQAAVLSAEVRRAVSGNQAMAQGIAAASSATQQGAAAFEVHASGARKATNALTALAASSIGAQGPISRLAESALLFSGGEFAVVAVAGAVLGLAAAFNVLTTAQREAEEKNQKLLSGLHDEAEKLNAAETAARGLAAAQIALARSQETLLQTLARAGGTVGQLTADPFASIVGETIRRQTTGQTDALNEQRQARQDLGDAEVSTLTEALQLQIATSAQQERAVELVKILTTQENALVVPQERRLEVAKQLLALQGALNNSAAANRAISDQHALQQQSLQAQEADLRAEFAQEAIIRDASLEGDLAARARFYEARRALAIAAARSDVQALGQQIEVAPTAEVEHLQSQITLRQQVLQAQLKQIANEERLAQLSALEKVGVVSAPQFLEPTLTLRPQVDATELQAALTRAIAAAGQAGLDDALNSELLKAAASADTLARVLVDVDLSLKDIGNANITGPKAALKAMNDAVHDVTRGLDSIVGAATNIGLIGEEAAGSINAVLNLADALANVAESASTGNILGAIAAGIGFVGSLVGGNPQDAERDRLLAENNEQLRQLRGSLDKNFAGAGSQENVGRVAELAAENPAFIKSINAQAQFDPSGALDTLDQQLRTAGSSLGELEAVARANGITLFQNGELSADALRQLAISAGLAAEAQTSFAKTFDEQTTRLELRARLAGEDTSSAAGFGREVTAASGLSSAVQQAFAGVDTKNEAALRAALQSLFDRFDKGEISAAELGGLSKDDFLKLLGDGADALDAFKDSVDEATKSTLNLPAGFRLNALAFQASDAGPPGGPVTRIPIPPPSIDPGRLTPRGGDGAQLPGFTGLNVTFAAGAIVQQPGEDGAALARRVIEELRLTALRQTGDTLNIGSPT